MNKFKKIDFRGVYYRVWLELNMCQEHGPLNVVTGVMTGLTVRTDVSLMAYRACVECMNEYMPQIESLEGEQQEKAKQHAMECIAYGDAETSEKIRALRHFMKLGWMNKTYIIEHMFHDLSLKQLKFFLKKGCHVTYTFQDWAYNNTKIEELILVSKFQKLRQKNVCLLGLVSTTLSTDVIRIVVSFAVNKYEP